MTKKKKRNNKDLLEFYVFLQKLKEKITILLDVNPSSGVDPIDEDIQLLHELHKLFDTTNMSWADKKNQEDVTITQLNIEDDDKVSENK